jgi:hypothetical protein
MITLREIDGFERQLKAAIVSMNKSKVKSVTLIEAIDEASVWPEPFDSLAPIVPEHDLDNLIDRAPLFICAVATEIGFRFEGVGTIFWQKFSDALGLTVTMEHRKRIADTFEMQSSRYELSRPSDSAFSSHFSIISWPISNALLPIDIIGPICRLTAKAPILALPGPGRSINFPSLRAWASAAEGARLADWLRLEGPAARVISALLTENRGAALPPGSYARLLDAVGTDEEASSATRSARMRSRIVKSQISNTPVFGRLSMMRDKSGIHLFASWPQLLPPLYDEARIVARAAGWRPRLWGVGSFLHPDNALSGGPFAIVGHSPLSADMAAYSDASAVFGAGSDIAVALASRLIDWGATLVFDVGEDNSQAEQRFTMLSGNRGLIWFGNKASTADFNGFRKIGSIGGYQFYEADLADPLDRKLLTERGLLSANNRDQLARHPIDAIGAPPGVVRPGRPFLLYKDSANIGADNAPQDLPPNGQITSISGLDGRPGVRAEAQYSQSDNFLDLILLERDRAFESLTEQRIQLRLESRQPLVKVKISVELEIAGRLVARGRDELSAIPLTLPSTASLFTCLYNDSIRTQLLEAGTGLLRITIGRSYKIEVKLERPKSFVDWADNHPNLVGSNLEATLVVANALYPHRFEPSSIVSTPSRGASIYGLLLSDGRFADPLQVFASKQFDYGDLTANFGVEIESRRMFDRGKGVADIARARIAWARARCNTLADIAAKTRIVRQFEAPLVLDLCGRRWATAEQEGEKNANDPHRTLWRCALNKGLAVLPKALSNDQATVFERAFVEHARILDPDWPFANNIPIDGAMDSALNLAFSEALEVLHNDGELLDIDDDFDFGAPSEDWELVANLALKMIRRTDLSVQIAPSEGGRLLSNRSFFNITIAEMAEDLAAWTKRFALPRGQLSSETAAIALQLWLSPSACDNADAAVRVQANDPFVARAIRYSALRIGLNNELVIR